MLILTIRQLSYSNGVYFYSFYVGNSNSTVEVSDTLYVLRDCEIFLQGIKQAAKVKFWMDYGRQFQRGAPFCWNGWNEKSTNQPCAVTHPYPGDSSPSPPSPPVWISWEVQKMKKYFDSKTVNYPQLTISYLTYSSNSCLRIRSIIFFAQGIKKSLFVHVSLRPSTWLINAFQTNLNQDFLQMEMVIAILA